ncbi:MAG: hypothetical protein ABJZ55_03130 [Fuerstiella sp.]
MNRTQCVLMLLLAMTFTGCAKSLLNAEGLQSMLTPPPAEQRVVETFRDALREENEPALRRISSTRFESLALRSEDVLSDLRVMRLPKGELSVVDVQVVSETEKLVVAKEDDGGRYQFRLVNDSKKGYWTVDDITVRRRHKGTQITKSTTEVMDLLVTVRSFLKVWESGEQQSILAMTSPRLKSSLESLPSGWMTALTRQIASAYEDGMARKPDASLNENDALVKLPARNGHLLMTIVRQSDQWLVDDVEFQNHRDDNHPGSVRRQADAIHTVTSFLQAYGESDHAELKYVTESKFYDSSLRLGNLSLIPLPSAEAAPSEFEIRAYEQQLTFMLPAGRQIVRVDLREQVSEIPEAARNKYTEETEAQSRFLVKEVTVYEKGSKQRRSLSAVFTAPARALTFLKALETNDRDSLLYLSTNRFAETVWRRLDEDLVRQLPVPAFHDEGIRLTNTHSIGTRTELEFENSAGAVLVCQLVLENGILKMDDIQYPNQRGLVASLKSELQLAAPVLEFANAWMMSDSELLQKACSADFNRLVWSHLDGVPNQFQQLPFQLRSKDVATTVTQERATMQMQQPGGEEAIVNLLIEHGHWVIDEIRLKQKTGVMVGVRQSLRKEVAGKILNGNSTVRVAKRSMPPVAKSQAIDMTEPGYTVQSPLAATELNANDFPEIPGTVIPVGFEEPAFDSRGMIVSPDEPKVDAAIYEQPSASSSDSKIRFADYARVVSQQQDSAVGRQPTAVTPLQAKGGQIVSPAANGQSSSSRSPFHFANQTKSLPRRPGQAGLATPAEQPSGFQLPKHWGPQLRQPADFPIAIPE